jgi:hypothetical protein
MSRTGSATSGDSRGRLYDEADDRDAQAAAPAYAHRGPARDVHDGPMGDGHAARAGEDHSIHQGPRENADDRCDGDGHGAADGAASAPEQGAREHAHCAIAPDPTPANIEQGPLDGMHAAHGAEHEGGDHEAHHDEGDTHEDRDDEGEHRGPDGTGDACEEHPGGDHEGAHHDDDAHRGRDARQDDPAGMEHAHDEGEHGGEHAGEHGPDEAHEQADCSSVIAGEDMLLFKDRSEWGDDEDRHACTAHEEEAHEIGAPSQPAATDDGPSEHGMHVHDHGQDPGHEMVCPPAHGDGLLML